MICRILLTILLFNLDSRIFVSDVSNTFFYNIYYEKLEKTQGFNIQLVNNTIIFLPF